MSRASSRAAAAAITALLVLQLSGTAFWPAAGERAGRVSSTDQPPVINMTFPADGAEVNGTLDISGWVSDPDSTVSSAQARIDDGPWLQARLGMAALVVAAALMLSRAKGRIPPVRRTEKRRP